MTSSTDSTSKPARRQRWLYVTIAILLLPIAASVYLSVSDSDIKTTAALNTSCDLHHGPCQSVFLGGGKVTLSIEPRPIAALKPLHIRVLTEDIDASSVAVDFRGVNMNMGYNRPQLKQAGPGQYTGTWVLASCGLERMVWEATVIIETAKTKMAAPFRLETSGK